MFDFTGNNLAGYTIRIIRDVVARNPRFRQSLGDVALTSNNQVSYQDVQCVIKDITAQGTRQSFDYSTISRYPVWPRPGRQGCRQGRCLL
jgi:hypothetical protein